MQLIAIGLDQLDEYGRGTWQYEMCLEIADGIVARRSGERGPALAQLLREAA